MKEELQEAREYSRLVLEENEEYTRLVSTIPEESLMAITRLFNYDIWYEPSGGVPSSMQREIIGWKPAGYNYGVYTSKGVIWDTYGSCGAGFPFIEETAEKLLKKGIQTIKVINGKSGKRINHKRNTGSRCLSSVMKTEHRHLPIEELTEIQSRLEKLLKKGTA